MTSETKAQILALGNRWAQAEQNADTNALDELAAKDFRLVGPFGFILDRDQWLQRYASGELTTSSLDWDEVEVREFGDDAVIAIGRHTQRATFAGRRADGQFRITHVFVRDAHATWRIANIQLSQLAAAPQS
jgi:ketosteroid isomerase-like protein